jgi:hypothetical protein
MSRASRLAFARRLFFWSGVYGILLLTPLFFLEHRVGQALPPATNHPEQYYAFLGVALAWQFVFLLIARDPLRYRPLMLLATAEKLLSGGAVLGLFMLERIAVSVVLPFFIDLFCGLLFVIAYLRLSGVGAESSERSRLTLSSES